MLYYIILYIILYFILYYILYYIIFYMLYVILYYIFIYTLPSIIYCRFPKSLELPPNHAFFFGISMRKKTPPIYWIHDALCQVAQLLPSHLAQTSLCHGPAEDASTWQGKSLVPCCSAQKIAGYIHYIYIIIYIYI